jgi:hypothetical protein
LLEGLRNSTWGRRGKSCNFHYPTTLAAFTLIIFISGMLKISKTIFFPTKTFVEKNLQEESICQNATFKLIIQQTCVEDAKAFPFGQMGGGGGGE